MHFSAPLLWIWTRLAPKAKKSYIIVSRSSKICKRLRKILHIWLIGSYAASVFCREGFSRVLGTFAICFSGSLPSISRTPFPTKVVEKSKNIYKFHFTMFKNTILQTTRCRNIGKSDPVLSPPRPPFLLLLSPPPALILFSSPLSSSPPSSLHSLASIRFCGVYT